MFRIPRYYYSQTGRCLKTLSSVRGVRKGVFVPCFSTRIWQPLAGNLSLTSHINTCVGLLWSFQRWFKVPSFLLHEEESCSNGNGNTDQTDEPKENKLVTPCKTLISQDVNHKYPGIIPSPDFLGIEVFPEIFDQLPPKCSGCGAVLQSNHQNKPGYIPKNRNPSLSKNDEENTFMSETICFRCFNVKHYNKDLPSVVSPETISNFLMHISQRKALILYSIDIMDIPGSFIPDILKIVGDTKHLILVCNKMDRLAVDGHPRHQVEQMKKIILKEAVNFGLENANVKDVCLISAKTGFGVKELIKSINKYWRKNSDMYIVGSNNTGKTTLFNLVADLFAASRHADDLLQRGTTSLSPGSTLSLLRFPITHHRFLRLQDRIQHGYSEEKNKENQKEVDLGEDIVDRQTTKYRDLKETTSESVSSASLSVYRPQFVTRQNEDDLCWLYDTPGLYNENQITHLLTNQELQLLNPSLWFVPRTLILKPGKVLFLGGLARVDYLDVERLSRSDHGKKEDVPKASQSVFFTVFASPNLPIHVTSLERAEMVYKEQAGGDLFKVPFGGEERMDGFPALSGRVLQVTGVDWKRSAADIILSNVGWIAVTAGSGSIVTVKAYTPNGVGLYLRDPSLLPTSVRQRGRRGVPYLGHVNYSIYQGTRRRSPSLVKLLVDENEGTQQWMKVAEKKRKQQRLLLKFEKTKWHSKKRIGFSAKSNPIRYLADYEDFPELQDERTNKNEGITEATSHQRLE